LPRVTPYKIGISVDRGTVSFDEQTREQYLSEINLARAKDLASLPTDEPDSALQAVLSRPISAEQFEKLLQDVQKFKTFQSLCSISRSWTSIKHRGEEPDNGPILAEALDRHVASKLYLNICFGERTIMGVQLSINKLLRAGYLKNEDFAGNDPKSDIINQRVLKPFLKEVLIPADFVDMPPEYMPWVVHELRTRTEEAARSHPAVKKAARQYVQDQLQNSARGWISTLTDSEE